MSQINDMKIIDKEASTWFVNTAAFRLHHPLRDHIFEPGVKYLMDIDEWMKEQPTLEKTTQGEDVKPKVRKPDQAQGRIDKDQTKES